ncbi:unnamed protein product [Phytomonas sp. Hart1]|nr:unnamed protein product [Phytomonas sp. Hart1]|eukprot:CCW66239.1 unnamed protein product [Phytomonas sp. isolate Hart1]
MLSKGPWGSPYRFEGPSHHVSVAYQFWRSTNLRCLWRSPLMCAFTQHLISTQRQHSELFLPSHSERNSNIFKNILSPYRECVSTLLDTDLVPHAENIAPGLFYCPMSEDMWYYEFPTSQTTFSSAPSHDLPQRKEDEALPILPTLKLKQSQAGIKETNGIIDSQKARMNNEVQPLGNCVDRFYVSPLCEAMGCLWQWRAVWCARTPNPEPPIVPPSMHRKKSKNRGCENLNSTTDKIINSPPVKKINKGYSNDLNREGESENSGIHNHGGTRRDSGGYCMLPFLILPSSGVLGSGYPLHLNPAVVSHLLYNTSSWVFQTRSHKELAQENVPDKITTSKPIYITIPSLVGNIIIKLDDPTPWCGANKPQLRPYHHATSFWNDKNSGKTIFQVFSPERQRTVDNIFNLLTPADSWRGRSDASSLQEVSHDPSCIQTLSTDNNTPSDSSQILSQLCSSDYTIPHSETTSFVSNDTMELSKLFKRDSKLTSSTSEVKLPLAYRNLINGGLAELILAVDCYAALIARKELTVASACWAILCDTKHSNILLSLRNHAPDIEREVLAAVEAQEHLMQISNRWNQTCVGKSSCAATTLMDYPAIAHWSL